MVDFNKRLKLDRINMFVDLVTKMAMGTPAEGYTIGDAVKQLPDNLKQFLLSEIPDSTLRAEYARRGLRRLDDASMCGEDDLIKVFKSEVYDYNELHTVCDLLKTDCQSPDEIETIEALLKLFPRRWTIDELENRLTEIKFGL